MQVVIWEWEKSRVTLANEINEINSKAFGPTGVIRLMFFYPMDDSLVLIGENGSANQVMKYTELIQGVQHQGGKAGDDNNIEE